jgi:hypothetical protein
MDVNTGGHGWKLLRGKSAELDFKERGSVIV